MAKVKATSRVEGIQKALSATTPRNPIIPAENYLSTGLSVVNLGLSGRVDGGIPKGFYVWFVGDSETGKTAAAMAVFAEACRNKNFDNYRLIYDNIERGNFFDTARLFGAKVLPRIEPPRGTRKNPVFSSTVEEFWFNLYDNVKDPKRPCIYIPDSMDGLDSKAAMAKFLTAKGASTTGEKVKGSYGMEKAKSNSDNARRIVSLLESSGSILFAISQTRDDVGAPFGGKTASGGKALRFYAHCQLWGSVRERLKKNVLGQEREVGNLIKYDVRKNRINGWHGTVYVPYYRQHGFDETGANIDFLTDEGYWSVAKEGRITAPEFKFNGGFRDALAQKIESEGDDRELQLLVQKVWDRIEDACKVKRRPRYE